MVLDMNNIRLKNSLYAPDACTKQKRKRDTKIRVIKNRYGWHTIYINAIYFSFRISHGCGRRNHGHLVTFLPEQWRDAANKIIHPVDMRVISIAHKKYPHIFLRIDW